MSESTLVIYTCRPWIVEISDFGYSSENPWHVLLGLLHSRERHELKINGLDEMCCMYSLLRTWVCCLVLTNHYPIIACNPNSLNITYINRKRKSTYIAIKLPWIFTIKTIEHRNEIYIWNNPCDWQMKIKKNDEKSTDRVNQNLEIKYKVRCIHEIPIQWSSCQLLLVKLKCFQMNTDKNIISDIFFIIIWHC